MTGDVLAAIGIVIAVVFYLHQDTKSDIRELRSLLYSMLQDGVKLDAAVKILQRAAIKDGKLDELDALTMIDFAPPPEPKTKLFPRPVVLSAVWVLVGAAVIWYGWRLYAALILNVSQ